jgi:hypothetical protein
MDPYDEKRPGSDPARSLENENTVLAMNSKSAVGFYSGI